MELEEEKEESKLKESQEKHKERRCLEYALYQRELTKLVNNSRRCVLQA